MSQSDASQPAEEPKKAKKRVPTWVWIVAGVFVLGIAFAGAGGGDSDVETTSPVSEAEEGTASETEAEADETEAPEPEVEAVEPEPEPEQASGYADGSYFVGDEIEPGIYRSVGGGFCYWERLSGFGGSFDEIISNGSGALEIAEISGSDVGFSSSGCGSWVPVEETFPDAPLTSFDDGVFVVGSHIEPGTYRADNPDGCYWDRLSGFGGSFSEIISNGFEQPIVEISASDAGFASEDCGTWSRQG